ncbi:MAG: hypothetical protein LCI02_18035 [Proteobacteria bacterium]|nr:hypothetical protein [Pseudomonadota bacterium]
MCAEIAHLRWLRLCPLCGKVQLDTAAADEILSFKIQANVRRFRIPGLLEDVHQRHCLGRIGGVFQPRTQDLPFFLELAWYAALLVVSEMRHVRRDVGPDDVEVLQQARRMLGQRADPVQVKHETQLDVLEFVNLLLGDVAARIDVKRLDEGIPSFEVACLRVERHQDG